MIASFGQAAAQVPQYAWYAVRYYTTATWRQLALLVRGRLGADALSGPVGMVQMALEKLSEEQIVDLDDERKAAMVSNLLVVLCGNHDAQPVVNSGSLY